MTISQAAIAIVGAGPAGLTFARLLELAGIDYVVFEQAESALWADKHSSSGTLDIHKGSGQAALKEAGLMADFQSLARWGVPVKFVDLNGNVVLDTVAGNSGEDKPEIDRRDLQKLLLGSIPASKVRWGFKILQVQVDSDGSQSVHCENGSVESGFRLVVTSAEPQYSGTHFFTTFLKSDNPHYSSLTSMVGNGNYLALNNGRQFFLHYLGDGSYHLAVGMKLPETWALEVTKHHGPSTLWQSLLRYEFAEWAPELTDLIKSSTHTFRSWPVYSIPKTSVPWKHTPGVTLLGDAAHLTEPTGDGVNNALQDSVELARCIIKHGIDDLDSAVVEYEKAMFPRAIEAIEKGQWFAEHLFKAESSQSFLQAATSR
ncbi:monoxygenase, putative [Talaromyces stipitatus ATCC 10500]|uniref:Monoxygenase, putative n=1 Tax=Talaromyces stipitatus (strain ATCC 10500 / CBS 375.48 / QM 6759 / NRRL 1006) TaxID=441959 RepID=B8M696_TALSN|nr:monooxygenase, putative [Talaromyces stipitatus ATCC 10500]EED19271.1 monoxygenase, putative [Talaromyces stipitatus ATCC 10500]